MKDESKTKQQLIEELSQYRQQVEELKKTMPIFATSGQELAVIGNSIQAGIYIIQHGKTMYVNSHISSYSGYSREELMNLSLMKNTVHPEDQNEVRERGIKMLKGEDLTPYEYRIVTKDGSVKWLMEKVTSIQVRGKRAVLGNTMDVTDKKGIEGEREQLMAELELRVQERTKELSLATEALQESKEFFNNIVENIPDMIFIKDAEKHQFVMFNKAGEELLGYTRDELIGKSDYDFFPKNEADFFTEKDREVLHHKKQIDIPEETIQTKYHGKRILHTKKIPILNKQGRPQYLMGISEDITERKKSEKALRESERLLSDIINFLPDATIVIDRDGRVIAWNRAIETITGIKAEEMLGKGNYEYTLPFYREKRPILMDLALHPNQEMEKRYTTFQRQGDILFGESYTPGLTQGVGIHLSATASVLRDSKGGVIGAIECIRDNTDRMHTERALRESERRLSDIIDFLPDATLVIDRDGKVIAWNKAMESMTGVTAENMLGKGDYEYAIPFYGDRRPILVDLVLQSQEDVLRKYKNIRRHSDTLIGEAYMPNLRGGEAYLLGTASPLYDTKRTIVGAIETITDITDRRKMEEALRENEERLRVIFDSVKDFIFIKDRNCRYVVVNNFFQKRFQVDPELFIGKTDEEIPIFEITEKTVSIIRETDDLVLLGETVEYEITHRVCGHATTFDIIKTPIWDEDGNITSICGLSRDVTERKKIEEERQRLEERLRRAEKMEALGTLAGGVAHDLNNVLGVLVGYSELLLEKIPEGSPLRKYVSNIQQSSERGAAIIQDLLTLARRGVAVSEIVNMNDIVSAYFRTLEFEKLKAYHLHVNFTIKLDKELMNIHGSPVHLSKTIMNLVSNASEAISGKGEVTIRTENCYLDKPVRGYDDMREGDYVVVSISDNGKGISNEDMGKIFEPFYTKKVMGRSGTGLGLAVVWGTVKDHCGYIDVQSVEGKGSTFTLYFPVTRDEIVVDQKVISRESYKGRGESILVVDDIHEQRELATTMLKGLGYQVEAVASGEDAVSYLKANRVDIMLLDMIMDPGIDGLETYQRVLEINPKQKAIIVSGFSETDRVKKAQELGAGAYVRKPYILAKIGSAIRRELDRKVS